jgi:hypothetical protein
MTDAPLKRFKYINHFYLLAIFLTLGPNLAQAASSCEQVYSISRSAVLGSKTMKQWLQWEVSQTLPDWQQERPKSPLPVVQVDAATVKVEALSSKDLWALESVLRPSSLGEIPWFQHPYNRDISVPNAQLQPTRFALAFHTASRTIVTEINGRVVSIKMPTDHPFGPTKATQSEKTKMNLDLKYSVARSKAIEKIDGQIGEDHLLIIQKELAAVIDIRTENGFLYRDMSAFKDGFNYLPGHLLPTVGKQLAAKARRSKAANWSEYWTKPWAKAIGAVQAKLLYRYGMEVRAINPQNFLIELDANMVPTGKIIWRDLAESHLIEGLAERIGLGDFVKRDHLNGGWGVHQQTTIKTEYLGWNFQKSDSQFPYESFRVWEKAHDLGFREEFERALGIKIPEGASINDYLNEQIKKGSKSEMIIKILKWHRLQKQIRIGAAWNFMPRVLSLTA